VRRALLVGRTGETLGRREGTERRFAAISRALAASGFETKISYVSNSGGFREAVGLSAPEIVFCFLHAFDDGPPGPHAILESLGIAYAGARQDDIDAAISKPAMKARWAAAGLATPEWVESFPAAEPRMPEGAGAWIIKPSRGGNSEGIGVHSIAMTREEARVKAGAVAERYGGAIAERYLGDRADFREFTAALIGEGENSIVSPVEIRLTREDGPRIVMAEDKAGAGTRVEALPMGGFADSLRAFARDCLRVAGMRDYGRCDIILADGKFWALEVNGQPMMPDPWFDACAAASGLDPYQAIRRVFASAIARREAALMPDPDPAGAVR
jgi:D-alanine-D-alanine ligase-like ATP-grasp enzyme